MRDWYLRDDGIPVEAAANIIGLNPSAFIILRRDGAFGPVYSDRTERASLREVACARALVDAERAGVIRDHALPFITDVGDSAYVYLAQIELSRRSWDPRYVTSSSIAELANNMHTDEGLRELQDRLGVCTRNMKPFAIFTVGQLVFSDTRPEVAYGQSHRFVDISKVAWAIKNHTGGKLFHGARGDMTFAA